MLSFLTYSKISHLSRNFFVTLKFTWNLNRPEIHMINSVTEDPKRCNPSLGGKHPVQKQCGTGADEWQIPRRQWGGS